LKAITSAKVRTEEATNSFRWAFKESLNSASNAVASPLNAAFKITSMLAISRLSIKTAPPCLYIWQKERKKKKKTKKIYGTFD
jgi:hypothetical protein